MRIHLYAFATAMLVLVASCADAGDAIPMDGDAATTTEQDALHTEAGNLQVVGEALGDSARKLRHIVLFNWNDNAAPLDVKRIEQAFAALPAQIPAIKAFEWGRNNSPEGLNKGLTHAFLVTFDSEEGRAEYLPHPAHQAFVELIGPFVEDVTVLDYWTSPASQ